MATSLSSNLTAQLQGMPMDRIAQQLGVDPTQASAAIGAALPLLLGALGRNASQPQGAQALYGALQKDHSGLDISSVLGAVLGNGGDVGGSQGGQILGHILGGKQPRAEAGVSQVAGIGNEQAGALMKILAPIVMAYLAKHLLGQGNAQAATQPGPQALGDMLGQEHQRVQQQGGLAGGLLGAVLDQDGDGELGMGDLLKIGSGFLGGRS